jgi:hypothetical protein
MPVHRLRRQGGKVSSCVLCAVEPVCRWEARSKREVVARNLQNTVKLRWFENGKWIEGCVVRCVPIRCARPRVQRCSKMERAG